MPRKYRDSFGRLFPLKVILFQQKKEASDGWRTFGTIKNNSEKRFTVDYLTRTTKVNECEVQQYYIEESHEAIIDPAE